ncbi:DNA modification methylase [uncultured Enterovirga sp.]|uniref:DNA modification methylase n=1 Tax=uncultured Enterovirga sp. TaxID=2026352 RepID=UPI0035CA9169
MLENLKAASRRRRAAQAKVANAATFHPPRNDMLPELQLVRRDPGGLLAPVRRKVRNADAAHIREVANAIAALGFCDPVLIDEDGRVLDGIIRVEAAKLLGLSAVPCILASHLTVAERRMLRLAVNRLGEKGEWDVDELKLELEELMVSGFPIEISGFSIGEVDQILIGEGAEAVEAGPLAPPDTARAVARLTDVFLLGEHRVVCGDATQPEALDLAMCESLARVVLTDQPYNVRIAGHVTGGDHREFAMASGDMTSEQFQAFNEAWIHEAEGHLVDGGLLATFIDWRGLSSVTAAAVATRLEQINLVVWGKTNAGMGSLYRSQHELLPIFKKGRAPHINNVDLGRRGRWRSNLWTYPGASSVGSDARRGLQHHPTVKPVTMLEDALLDVTNRGDIVLDPFLGSGSTLIAAEKTGRVCRGVELDPLYVDVIATRYQEVTGRQAVLESTGETFTEVRTRRAGERATTDAADISQDYDGDARTRNSA